MNKQATTSVVRMDTEELRALVTTVEETLATEVIENPSNPVEKKFGILDLRKMRSKSRSSGILIR